LDRVIVSGGEKIPPEQVEAALLELPGLRRAVVVPVADETWGARPVAFVEWEAGHALGLEELRCRLDALPRHWHPVALLPWPQEETSLKVSPARLEELATAWRGKHSVGEACPATPGRGRD
jgi:O-succinylbenzoic acid--CoA ligase